MGLSMTFGSRVVIVIAVVVVLFLTSLCVLSVPSCSVIWFLSQNTEMIINVNLLKYNLPQENQYVKRINQELCKS